MTPVLRKLALTAHVALSVGWMGAVSAFLALAIAGLMSKDMEMFSAAYRAMPLIAWFVIIPFAFASLFTGLLSSLGTTWGLFRHYWVLSKLLLSTFATGLLLLHTKAIDSMAAIASGKTLSGVNSGQLQIQLVADASAALLVLLVNTALGIYKPRGMTAYGQRKQQEEYPASVAQRADDFGRSPLWIKVFAVLTAGLIVAFLILHLAGRGLGALHH